MRFSTLFLSLGLAASSLGQPIQHQHHAHAKREAEPQIVVTVTVTGPQSTVYAAAADVPTTLATSYADSVSQDESTDAQADSTTLESEQSSWSADPEASSDSAVSSDYAVSSDAPSSTSDAPSSSTSSSDASSSTSSSDLPSGEYGGAKGISYSPYSTDGCKSADQVKSEVSNLSQFEIIRIYGVDCNQVENVLAAIGSDQKLFLGVYDITQVESSLETIRSAVMGLDGNWDRIHTISIGNELVNSGSASVETVGAAVSSGRDILQSWGFPGKVVTVDTFIAVINNPGLCSVSDYVVVNAHAYFDGGVTADQAGQWLSEQIDRVASACSVSADSILIGESGWPHAGNTNGVAVPSPANEVAAVTAIVNDCGSQTILFTAYDDLWKQPGSYGVEQSFGIFGVAN